MSSREKPFEDVWREWVKKVSKLPQGSLTSQAIAQLTISGLSRRGQPEPENHLRFRAPLAWQDVQTQVDNYLSTIYHQQSPQPGDISAVTTGSKSQSCGSQNQQRNDSWYNDETCKICGKRGHLAKVCRSGNAQPLSSGSPNGTSKQEKVTQVRARSEHQKHVCAAERKDTKKTDCELKSATCSDCGKVGRMRAVCRNTNTHEVEKDADEPSPEAAVEDVWCVAVQDVVEDGHCVCTEELDISSEHRDESKVKEFPEQREQSKVCKAITNIETGQKSRKVTTNIETGQNLREAVTNIETGQNLREVITNIETAHNPEKWSLKSR